MIKKILIPVVVIGNLLSVSSLHAAARYTIKGFNVNDTLVSRPSSGFGFDINNSGDIVGYTENPANHGEKDAFVTVKGISQRILTLPGSVTFDSCVANAINDKGLVVGYSNTYNHAIHAFLQAVDVQTDLGTLGGTTSYAYSINASNQITGESTTTQGYAHAFLTQKGPMLDLGTLTGGITSKGYDINKNGQVTGASTVANGDTHAFVTKIKTNTMIDIGTLGGNFSEGRAINDNGYIVGSSTTTTGKKHAFVRNSYGHMADLGAIGWTSSDAYDINNNNEIVGSFYAEHSGVRHAFVSVNGKIKDLNRFVEPASGWVLVTANAINDKGQITGVGVITKLLPDGSSQKLNQAFVLTPITRR